MVAQKRGPHKTVGEFTFAKDLPSFVNEAKIYQQFKLERTQDLVDSNFVS